ncbi:hypothetical protein PRK78_005534 [Emydomyces testavorans]|uniref:Uncharacterized protein n=1 Tax=Emydomyces testavorans TaxID=2070801 RepID=A0AAF0DNL6_9EURO|nr:hypothetical protein PRK78_005534 [Emydomyces testavorans]
MKNNPTTRPGLLHPRKEKLTSCLRQCGWNKFTKVGKELLTLRHNDVTEKPTARPRLLKPLQKGSDVESKKAKPEPKTKTKTETEPKIEKPKSKIEKPKPKPKTEIEKPKTKKSQTQT